MFAGSFDPFTLGHLDIVKRAAAIFDELWVVLAVNASKKNMFSQEERLTFINKSVAGISHVKVTSFDGLTVDFMKSVGSKFLIRGVRGAMDVEYEQSIAWNNRMLYPECETVILPSSSEHLSLSSSVVRELLKAGVLDTQDGRELLSNYVHVEIIPLLLKSSH